MLFLKNGTIALLVSCIALAPCSFAQAQREKKEVLVPKDVKLAVEILSPLSTKTNQKGDKFSCRVLAPAEYSNSLVTGHIRKAKSSGKAKGKSEMDLGFDTITFPDGRVGTFNAQVLEVFDVVDAGEQGRADNEGAVKGKSTVKRDALKIGVATAIGALLGGILLGGKGAAIGAAVGAGIGVSTTLATKGPDLEFNQGTQLTLVTNSPSHLVSRSEVASLAGDKTPSEGPAVRVPTLTSDKPSGSDTASSSGTQRAVLANPNPPSPLYNSYHESGLFRLSVPANWRESSSKNPTTFAPEGGYIFHRGQPQLTHGVIVGVLSVQVPTLQQASDSFLNSIVGSNPYLSLKVCKPANLAGRQARVCSLSGLSTVTRKTELVDIHTAFLRDGQMFYLIAVVPDAHNETYASSFQKILSSIRFGP